MVRVSSSTGKCKTGALRIDMKRKLPLPPPFVVSRGYTPDYPWLGQDHPAPKPRRPRLLMQQSCSGAVKAAVCVVCAVLGIALILYAGNAIIRGAVHEHDRVRDAHGSHDVGPVGLHPQHEALVQDRAGEDVVGTLNPGEAGLDYAYAPGPDEHVGDDGGAASPPHLLRLVDPVLPDVDEPAAPEGSLSLVQAVEDGEVAPGALQATKHLLLWMRMANLVGAQREMQERVQVTEALRGAYDKLQAAEAAMAVADDDHDVVVSELGQTNNAEARPEDQPHDHQEDLQQQDTVDEDARLLMQWMMQAQPAEQDEQEQPQEDTVDEDARLLAQWIRQAKDQDVEQDTQHVEQDTQQDAQQQGGLQDDQQDNLQDNLQVDLQGDDAETVRQILLWLTSSPQSWDVEEPVEQLVEAAEQHEPVLEPVLPLNENQATASAAVSPIKPLSEDEAQPEPATTVVPWDQLNEDDKQDALLPKLAARGLDLHQEKVAVEGPAASMVVDAGEGVGQSDDDGVATQVESDVHVYEPQGELHGASQDPQDPRDEGEYEAQQAQHYRHLVSQRFPLMYHVLHLRRSQQDAVQQEQRATAYLRLLDLHLLQHRQEAEARRRQRQHQQDVLRLQQDEALWAQQDQWVQQEQQEQQEQQSYPQGQSYISYTQQRPVRHLHGRVHHHRRHQHAF